MTSRGEERGRTEGRGGERDDKEMTCGGEE